MVINETPGSYSFQIDRGYPVGASEQIDQRLALHTRIKNPVDDPVLVSFVPVSYTGITLSYDPVTQDITQVVYTFASGPSVTLNLTYDAYSNLTGVAKL